MDAHLEKIEGGKAALPFEPITLYNDAPVDPELGGVDLLDFLPLAKEVAAIAVGTEGPFTVAVTARWGHGKTSMLRLVRDLINKYGAAKGEEWRAVHTTVWFNAWQYEREDEPLVPLLVAIQDALLKNEEEHTGFWKSAGVKSWEGLRQLPRVLGVLASSGKAKTKVRTPWWVRLFGGVDAEVEVEVEGAKLVESICEGFRAEKEVTLPVSTLMKALRDLNKISKDLRSATAKLDLADRPKIVVFVDDLDRCHPDAALRLLDGIKLVLEQPGFMFVMGLDKTILEEFLVQRYHKEYGASNAKEVGQRYIDKIIQLEIPLPPQTGRFAGSTEEQRLTKNFAGQGYLERVTVKMLGPDYAFAVADVIRPCTFLSPRDVVRLLLRLQLNLGLYTRVGKPLDGFGGIQVVIAATVMLLLEGVLVGSYRGDFLDLVADQAVGERLWDSIKSGVKVRYVPPEDSGEETTPTLLLSEALFDAISTQRGLISALAAHGEQWMTDSVLRRRLAEFLAPHTDSESPSGSQSFLVHEAVRRALNVREGEPIPEDWSSIRELSLPVVLNDDGLRLVAQCTGLTDLDLSGTAVTDLSAVQGLDKLTKLDFSDTVVSDLIPIAGLVGLETLYFSNTEVSDITDLNRLTGLKRLNLSNTKVSDLTPLSNCTQLQRLKFYRTSVLDLAPLASLTSLTDLELGRTNVKDISPLMKLAQLRDLDLGSTSVIDLSPLEGLTKLASLSIIATAVSDITPLMGMDNLARLYLGSAKISDDQKASLQRALPYLKITT